MTGQHPSSQAGGVEHVVAGLASASPESALVDAATWIESLIGKQGVLEEDRLRLLFALDEAVQAHARVFVERYLAAVRHGAAGRRNLWANVRGHWALLLDAYGECLTAAADEARPQGLGPELLTELAVRTIRTGAQRAKWDAFRHGPVDEHVWSRLNLAYRLAVRAGLSHRTLRLRADRATETSVEREYMRAVALHSVGMDQLDAERLELAARVIHYALPYLELAPSPSMASLTWVDAAFSLPPTRLTKTPAHATLPRFFSGMVAVPSLEELLDLVVSGDMPMALQPGGDTAPGVVASVLAHIIKGWSNQPPTRRHRRHPMPGQVLVVEGLVRFVAKLSGDAQVLDALTWNMRDASLQGVGLEAPLDDAEELRVGTLIGMHSTDGNCWRVGTVRRVWRTSEHTGQVGVELLGGTPVAASADDGSQPLHVLLLDAPQRGQPVRVAVPLPGPRANQALYLLSQGRTVKLTPLTTLEYGADFEIRAYLFAG